MIALVTGANRGLGLEACRQLVAKGWRVVLAARKKAEAEEAARGLGGPEVALARGLDVTQPERFATFAEQLFREVGPLDALINNAGVYKEGPEKTIAVNVIGPWRLTDALAPRLAEGARVVMVSSGLGSLSGFPPERRREVLAAKDREALQALVERYLQQTRSWPAPYSVSKALLNALTAVLARELSPRGIKVNAVSPGWVRTRMGGAGAPRSVEEGASGIVWAATLPGDGPTGGVFEDRAPLEP